MFIRRKYAVKFPFQSTKLAGCAIRARCKTYTNVRQSRAMCHFCGLHLCLVRLPYFSLIVTAALAPDSFSSLVSAAAGPSYYPFLYLLSCKVSKIFVDL